jgi:hypothetical protein
MEAGRGGEVRPVRGKVADRSLDEGGVGGPGPVRVVGLEAVPGGDVYDFETTTENYYCCSPGGRSLLVHNCYINNGVRGYRGAGLVVVDPRYPEKVRRQVSKFRTATAFYMSSFTDPFNPLQVNPIVAGITSYLDICELIDMLADAGADHLIFKFVEIVYPSRAAIVRNMKAAFGERADAFESLFTQQIGGVYTIDEEYRKEALGVFADRCKAVGVTMALCYEYEYARNPDGSIRDKTGVSMGAKYLTADQCHGHRVPMFTRDAIGDPWREVESCPPSGCLTCSDQFPTGVPCGSEILASAPALTPAHLRVPAEPKFPTLPVLPS